MSLFHVYLFNNQVIVPTVSVTDTVGFYLDLEPVYLFNINDKVSFQNHLAKIFGLGNQVISTPSTSNETGSVLLEKLNLRKWSDFESKATMYTIHFSPGYTIIYSTITGTNNTWKADQHIRKFARHAPIGIILEALSQDIISQHKKNINLTNAPSKYGLLRLN